MLSFLDSNGLFLSKLNIENILQIGFDDIYNEIQKFKAEHLKHCSFQLWYPDKSSEENFYTNKGQHGATLTHLHIDKSKEEFLGQIFKECDELSHLKEMSVVKYGMWPVILIGCRHYRFPIPIHFLQNDIQKNI